MPSELHSSIKKLPLSRKCWNCSPVVPGALRVGSIGTQTRSIHPCFTVDEVRPGLVNSLERILYNFTNNQDLRKKEEIEVSESRRKATKPIRAVDHSSRQLRMSHLT